MRRLGSLVVATAVICALVLGWGYWHAMTHAYLHIQVDDIALRSEKQAYGAPHDVTVTFRDRSNVALATAKSIFIRAPTSAPVSIAPEAATTHPATSSTRHGPPVGPPRSIMPT
jgi:hypothetical protein